MERVTDSLKSAAKKVFNVEIDPVLTRPDEQFGDFATNAALQLSKQLGKNPREIAEALAANLQEDHGIEAVVAGPGFINITVPDAFLDELSRTGPDQARMGQRIVIETNNPNPFKAMHIGHAFNAVLADTVANLLEADGAEVHRVSYHGDVGLHVGRSMYSLLTYVDGDPGKLQDIPADERNSFMSRMYAEGARAHKEDPKALDVIDSLTQQSFVLDDPLYRTVYETCKAWSFEGIEENVQLLGNKPIEKRYLESEADAAGVATVKEHPEVFIESDGAFVFPGERYGIFDNVFVSSNGRGLYAARDLGLMQLKHRDYQAGKSYIVTAEEQKDYFRGVIKAAELCLPELANITVNISTGTVKLSTGKMSSRDGEVLEIAWLFDRITEAIGQRGGQPGDGVVAGALRYQFLKVRIGSDVVFDVNEAVSLQGNSGPYLQYAHARACSILEKSTLHPGSYSEGESLQSGERSLLRKLSEYPEVMERATSELMPHHICTYLYELAQTFNRFYEHHHVIGDEREAVRLRLIERYAATLKQGLDVLGIVAPERM